MNGREEAFVELLPDWIGFNLRHFGPEREHVVDGFCDCQPEGIPHGSVNRCVKCGSERVKVMESGRRYCIPCRARYDRRKQVARRRRRREG